MSKLTFSTNVPQLVHLNSLEGVERESQFGGVQHQFSAAEGTFYVSEAVGRILAAQFRKLGLKAGEPAEICKTEVDAGRGRKSLQWIVSLPLGAEADAPPPPVKAKGPVAVPAPVPAAQSAADASPRPRWAETLAAHTSTLVDVYAAVLKDAGEKHGNAVKPETVQSLLVTMFIQYAQKGGISNAA
jgi:hypothetical protein